MKKVLIIRFSSIGDIVLTTPVIRCLKTQLNESEIHFLTKKSFLGALNQNPYLDKIHSIEKNTAELIDELKKENYDYIIDLHNNIRTKSIKIKLRKPSISFRKLNIEKWLLVNLKINKMPDIHIVDRYLETVKSLGINNDNKGLDYFIAQNDELDLASIPESHRAGYIAFVIGGQHATKRLTNEKISAICREIKLPIILLGGKEDLFEADKIESSCKNHNIFNACGRYSLNQSAGIIKQARKVITHDTGLMHIAAAYKKDILSIWGNTVPAFGMYPYLAGQNSKIVEVKNLSCRPCSKIGFDKCPKGHFKCMNLIDETEIINWANQE